jgi:hypothetical protein
MDFFKYFTTGLTLATVDKLSKKVKSTSTFKYFSDSDTNMVKEYKDFNVTIIASALAVIALEMDLKNPSHKKDIQTVYIGKSAGIIRKIMSLEYKFPELQVDREMAEFMYKGNVESHLCFQTHVLFEKTTDEIKKSLKENSAFYFNKYDKPHYNEYTGENEYGESRLFSYIWNLMLAKEAYDYEDYENEKMIISHNCFTDLNESEINLLNSFVEELSSFLKD